MAVRAIGAALLPDDVVRRTPRSVKVEKIGLSTPADMVCNQRRFSARRTTPKKFAARSGHASWEKKASVIRARSRRH